MRCLFLKGVKDVSFMRAGEGGFVCPGLRRRREESSASFALCVKNDAGQKGRKAERQKGGKLAFSNKVP